MEITQYRGTPRWTSKLQRSAWAAEGYWSGKTSKKQLQHQLAPGPHDLLLQVDATYAPHKRNFGVGFVILQPPDKVVLQKPRCLISELVALQKALQFVMDMGYTNIRVYSDSLLAVRAVTAKLDYRYHTGTIVEEIKSILKR